MSPKLLDTHIHLWPSTATSNTDHAWMNTPEHPLAKRHGISDYQHAISASSPSPTSPNAFVYVETDRYLPSPSPSLVSSSSIASEEEQDIEVKSQLAEWAAEPLNELRFLRRIVEGTPEDAQTDGFEAGDGAQMKGIVAWAPLHLSPFLLSLYLQVAEAVAGPETWARVVGFRFLLQGINDEGELRYQVGKDAWLENMVALGRGRGGRGWSFDIGVDTRSGGVWQVECIADMVETVRGLEAEQGSSRTKFILNHLCKPDLTTTSPASASRWKTVISRLAAQPAVYMKFSGAFSEFGATTPWPASRVLEHLSSYAGHAFQAFGSERIMFGSDWPVCNVFGPKGEESWGAWREVVEAHLSDEKLNEEQKERVRWGTGMEAYGIRI